MLTRDEVETMIQNLVSSARIEEVFNRDHIELCGDYPIEDCNCLAKQGWETFKGYRIVAEIEIQNALLNPATV